MRVVEDAGERLVLWCPEGTVRRVPVWPESRPRPRTRPEWFVGLLTHGDWGLAESVWEVSSLMLLHAGDWHATWVSFLEDGVHWGWYVNLQEPFRRTERGLATMDLMLDVVVDPDRFWRWKDVDDFDAVVANGLVDAGTAEAVRSAAAAEIARAERGEPPFDETWLAWRPPPDWSRPSL